MSLREIRNVARSKKSTPEEGRRAVLSGLQTRSGQREAYKMLQEWKERKGIPGQSRLAEGVLGKLSKEERKQFAQGKLSPTTIQKIKNSRAMRAVAPSGTSSQRNRPTPPGTGAGGGAAGGAAAGGAPTQVNASNPMSTVTTAKQNGVEVSEDLKNLQERRINAAASGNTDEVNKIDAQIQKDHKDELGRLQKINTASPQLTQVRTSAQSVKDVNDTTQVQDLEKKLAAADTALKTKITDDDKRKEILGQVFKKAAGDKAEDIVSKSNKVAKLVKL